MDFPCNIMLIVHASFLCSRLFFTIREDLPDEIDSTIWKMCLYAIHEHWKAEEMPNWPKSSVKHRFWENTTQKYKQKIESAELNVCTDYLILWVAFISSCPFVRVEIEVNHSVYNDGSQHKVKIFAIIECVYGRYDCPSVLSRSAEYFGSGCCWWPSLRETLRRTWQAFSLFTNVYHSRKCL